MTELLGETWIKKFDAATTSVASDGPRLLHIDGHCSHVSIPLLEYVVAANIIVFGFPPHTTHLLQGLDVVLFSPFKHAFAKCAAEHLSNTGRDVDKCDFLQVLHCAVEDSFTKDNILTAWRKTGLRPVDPSVIADKDLAASKPFSIKHHTPLEPPSPIRPLITAIQEQLQLQTFRLTADHTGPRPLTPLPPMTPSLEAHLPTRPSGSLTQLAHPLSFPSPCSDLPDALELITTKLSTVSLGAEVADDGPPTPTPTKTLSPQELGAAYGAGDALHGLASTSMAGLLDQETVTSELKLPPVPQGHLPYDVVKAVQECKGMPSKELWEATRSSMLHLVPWMEQVLAQCVLQQTYCDQLQAKLHTKEKAHGQNKERKILGLKGGVIWTEPEIVEGLRTNRALQDEKKEAAEKRSKEKQLKVEAEEWKKSAKERQEYAHQALLSHWALSPEGRKPRKPRLEAIPDIYKKVLKPKKHPSHKKKVEDSSDEENAGEDPDYDEMM